MPRTRVVMPRTRVVMPRTRIVVPSKYFYKYLDYIFNSIYYLCIWPDFSSALFICILRIFDSLKPYILNSKPQTLNPIVPQV